MKSHSNWIKVMNDDGVIKLIFFAFKNREFNNHKKKIVFEGQLQEATTMRNLF